MPPAHGIRGCRHRRGRSNGPMLGPRMHRFKEPVPAEDPIVRQTRVRRVSSTREEPEKWTPAHASKAACANQLPASLSAKRTAAFGTAHQALGTLPFDANHQGWQGQFWGQSRGQKAGA